MSAALRQGYFWEAAWGSPSSVGRAHSSREWLEEYMHPTEAGSQSDELLTVGHEHPLELSASEPTTEPSPSAADQLNRKVQPKILLEGIDMKICYTVDLASDSLSSLHEWKSGETEGEMSSPWSSAWGGRQAKRESRCLFLGKCSRPPGP